jgi:hypothetical protein
MHLGLMQSKITSISSMHLAKTCQDILKAHGSTATAANKGPGNIVDGI